MPQNLIDLNNSNGNNSIIDNTLGRKLINVIKDQLKKTNMAKFAIGYFFLNGFSLVKEDFPENYKTLPFLKMVMGKDGDFACLMNGVVFRGSKNRDLI